MVRQPDGEPVDDAREGVAQSVDGVGAEAVAPLVLQRRHQALCARPRRGAIGRQHDDPGLAALSRDRAGLHDQSPAAFEPLDGDPGYALGDDGAADDVVLIRPFGVDHPQHVGPRGKLRDGPVLPRARS